MSWLKEVAPLKNRSKPLELLIAAKFHDGIGWLKLVAFWKKLFAKRTLFIVKDWTAPLKAVAPLNISEALINPVVFQGKSWLNTVAPLNISNIASFLLISQLLKGWLNAVAPWNIRWVWITLLVFQVFKGWLNALASWNISYIRLTLIVFHPEISWLKTALKRNIAKKNWAEPVSHPPISWSKIVLWNIPLKLTTLETSHSPI